MPIDLPGIRLVNSECGWELMNDGEAGLTGAVELKTEQVDGGRGTRELSVMGPLPTTTGTDRRTDRYSAGRFVDHAVDTETRWEAPVRWPIHAQIGGRGSSGAHRGGRLQGSVVIPTRGATEAFKPGPFDCNDSATAPTVQAGGELDI